MLSLTVLLTAMQAAVSLDQSINKLNLPSNLQSSTQVLLSFDEVFPSLPLADSPPCDLQITAYK